MPKTQFDHELEERLVRYCRIDTQADEKSPTSPSTAIQFDLLNLLVDELKEIGAQEVTLTDYGAVLATLPATVETRAPVVGFLAHVDTAPAFHASGVKPIVHRTYDGGDIVLPDDPTQVISPAASPYLASKVGKISLPPAARRCWAPTTKPVSPSSWRWHGTFWRIRKSRTASCVSAFTPDEEIGRGVHKNLPADLGAKFAYTLDGGEVGEVVYETFSADKATVLVQGVSTHPGDAKNKLVNALHLAAKIIDTLPHVTLTPETTEDRQGFVHIYQMTGTAAAAELNFILRDFELEGLQAHGDLVQQVCAAIQATEPCAHITCTITPQYRNMRYWLENDMRPVELANQACSDIGVEPFSTPTRGGTDGSRLTEMGVPTPNLFTGMQNIHGPLEWISVQDMGRATEMCVRLAQLWGGDTA